MQKIHWLFLIFALLLTIVSACGDDDDDDSSDSATTDDDDDTATDDDSSDDDAVDDDQTDDDSSDDDTFLTSEVDCFDNDGIDPSVEICQYYGTDLVGRAAQHPGRELINAAFPDGFTYVERDEWSTLIAGTDLGNNVKVGNTTWYFFGDTHPVKKASSATGAVVGLPWGHDTHEDYQVDSIAGVSTNDFLYESVTDYVAYDSDGNPTGLLNQHERNYIFPNGEPGNKEVPFFVPTGLAAVDDTIYYWYGKYINNANCDQSHLTALDTNTGEWRYISPFAQSKFIQVNAIEVDRSTHSDSDTCPLPWTENDERGLLIFGSGRDVANTVSFDDADPSQTTCTQGSTPGYRVAKLFLGYIKLENLEDPQVPTKMYYFTGEENGCWQQGVTGMAAAVPVIDNQTFGEFSLRRVPETDYLILVHSYQDAASREWLQQHPEYQNTFFSMLALNVANIAQPWKWTDEINTNAYGYGNYVIEESIKIVDSLDVDGQHLADDVLFFSRVISTWKGPNADPNFTEYGTSLIWSVVEFDDLMAAVDGNQ